MIAYLWNILVGNFCKHTWSVYQEIPLFEDDGRDKRPVGKMFILKCAHCGNLKSKKFKG